MNKLSTLNWQGMPIQIHDPEMYPRKVKTLVMGGEFIAYRPNNDPTLPTYMESAFTDRGSECILLADDWMGFNNMGLHNLQPYQLCLEDWVANNPDTAAEITDLVFVNGFRDFLGLNLLSDRITDCLASARSMFPDARIHTVFTGWGAITEADFPDYYATYTIQKERTYTLGYDWIPIEALCHTFNDTVTPDPGDVHGITYFNLTETGCSNFTTALAEYLINGTVPERTEPIKAVFKPWSGISTTSEYFSYIDVKQRVNHMYTNGLSHFVYDITQQLTCDGTMYKIAYGTEFQHTCVFGHQNVEGKEWSAQVMVILYTTTSEKIVLPARLYIYQGDIYVMLNDYGAGGVAKQYIVTDLYLGPFDITCDSMMN